MFRWHMKHDIDISFLRRSYPVSPGVVSRVAVRVILLEHGPGTRYLKVSTDAIYLSPEVSKGDTVHHYMFHFHCSPKLITKYDNARGLQLYLIMNPNFQTRDT